MQQTALVGAAYPFGGDGEEPRSFRSHKGRVFQVRFLHEGDLDGIMKLQGVVFDGLKAEGQENFIVPKEREAFAHFVSDRGRMLGVFCHDTGKLVAQAIFGFPTLAFPETGMEYPGTDMGLVLMCPVEEISVYRGGLVHPDYRGNRLMLHMLGQWRVAAALRGRRHLIAEVAAANWHSWPVMLADGMTVAATAVDPADGCQLFHLYRPVQGPVETEGDIHHFPTGPDSFRTVTDMLRNGYVGCAWDRLTRTLGLARRKEEPL